MHPRLRSFLVLLMLLAGSFATYYHAIADLPRKDHVLYLVERVFVETDWDWFWHSVSLSRTRLLYSGDNFLFRPLHMAVIALKDIFFRNNLFALGAINITTMAVAAFSLYFFSSRLLKPALAFVVALLFMVQYAGLEIVAWGHINPYLLAVTFFGFAMSVLLEAGPDNKASLKKAGAFLLLGALVYEMVVAALVLAALLLIFVRLRAGKSVEIGGLPLRLYLIWVIALPVLVYLGLNLLDYLYHGAPPLVFADGPASEGNYGPLGSILTVVGASAVAFLIPFKVNLIRGDYVLLSWNFENMRPVMVAVGAVLSIAMVPAIYRCFHRIRTGKSSTLTLTVLFVFLLFIGVVLGYGLGRVWSIGVGHLYYGTHLYSITAYIFCLILAIGMSRFKDIFGNGMSLFLSRAALIAMVLLIAINFVKTREALRSDWPERKKFAQMHLSLDEALVEHSPNISMAYSLNYDLGVVYEDRGIPERPIEYNRTTLKLKRHYALALNNLGSVLGDMGRLEEAIEYLQISIELNPEDATAHNNLGNAYANIGQSNKAIKHCLTAIELKPGYTKAHFNLGLLYLEEGLLNSARAEFETVLRIDPQYPMAAQFLEYLDEMDGQ